MFDFEILFTILSYFKMMITLIMPFFQAEIKPEKDSPFRR